MSTNFYAPRRRTHSLNLSSANAAEVLRWLGVDPRSEDGLVGEIAVTELAALCTRRLWPEARNSTPAIAGEDQSVPGQCRFYQCEREENYHQRIATQLLEMCNRAMKRSRKGMVRWD